MNLDHDFVQVSKLSENQKKKGFSPKINIFFSKFRWRPKKQGLHQKWNTFFPRFQVDTYAQMHTQSQTDADADLDHIQTYWVGYSQIIKGYIPPIPPGFGTPGFRTALFMNLGCNEGKTNTGWLHWNDNELLLWRKMLQKSSKIVLCLCKNIENLLTYFDWTKFVILTI